MKRIRRNLVERETAKQRAITDEFRHHDPFGPPELVFAHEDVDPAAGGPVERSDIAVPGPDPRRQERLGQPERRRAPGRLPALHGLLERDEVVGGAELQSTKTATTVRVRNGDTLVTDGPYAEVKEALGGYFILECDSIDEACRLAAQIPAAQRGAIEVRPAHVEEES